MDTHLALLRSVNVGGHGRLAMQDLRNVAESLGVGDVRTLLQTGNLICRSQGGGAWLEAALEAALAELGLATAVMVRSPQEWDAVLRHNPFHAEAADDPSHLLVYVLKSPTGEAEAAALRAAVHGPERVHVEPSHLYVTYPDGIGRSKLTTAAIEACLGTTCTGRNWNTALKLAKLSGKLIAS